MKRIVFLFFLVWTLAVPVQAANLPPAVEDALPEQAELLMKHVNYDLKGDLFRPIKQIATGAVGQAQGWIRQQFKGALTVLLAVLLSSVAEGFYQGLEKQKGTLLLPMIGALSITLLTTGSLNDLMGLGTATIHDLSIFSKALLPTLAAASAAMGGVTTATVRQVATVFFVDLFLNLTDSFLVPLVYLYVGALAASSCLPGGRLESIAQLLKKIVVWILTCLLLLFTVYLSVSSIFSGVVDSASVRVAKAAISGAVPIVGGIIAEASETILAGAGLLRGSIGLFGVLGIFAACAVPFLRMGAQYLFFKIIAFMAATVGPPGLCKLVDGLGGAFGLMLGMTGSCALLLLISVLASVAAVVP